MVKVAMKFVSLLILVTSFSRSDAFWKKIDNLELKLPEFHDLVSKVPKLDDLISKVPKMDDLVSKLPKMDDLVSKVPKIDDLLSKLPKMDEFIPNLLYKCIEGLDCFNLGSPFFHPKHRPFSLPPSSDLESVRFILFTPNNPQKGEELDTTAESMQESSFDRKAPLKVLIHGYNTKLKPNDVRFRMKDAFLNSSNYNVIIVDWSKLSKTLYPQAVANARAVGALLAKLLKEIMKSTGYKARKIHLIGHSLGGQMSGWTGERIPNLGRITGLDPAGPYFQNAENEVRLDTTDARFVDVIHTNGGDGIIEGLGLSEPIGHMDFYPNGGIRQPGCVYTSDDENFGSFINATSKLLPSTCSHSRANHYFLESIDNSRCRFLATQCESYSAFENGKCLPPNSTVAEMGLHAKRIRGVPEKSKFYLRTNDQEPFCNQDSIYL